MPPPTATPPHTDTHMCKTVLVCLSTESENHYNNYWTLSWTRCCSKSFMYISSFNHCKPMWQILWLCHLADVEAKNFINFLKVSQLIRGENQDVRHQPTSRDHSLDSCAPLTPQIKIKPEWWRGLVHKQYRCYGLPLHVSTHLRWIVSVFSGIYGSPWSWKKENIQIGHSCGAWQNLETSWGISSAGNLWVTCRQLLTEGPQQKKLRETANPAIPYVAMHRPQGALSL